MRTTSVRRWLGNAAVVISAAVACIAVTAATAQAAPAKGFGAEVHLLAAPTVANPGNQNGVVSTPATFGMVASGGTAPYTWSATGLPAGKFINASTGVISGAPTTVGTYWATITAVDATGLSGSTSFYWYVTPLMVVVPNLTDTTVAWARSYLPTVGLQLGTVGSYFDRACNGTRGYIGRQNPKAGTVVVAGTAINVYLPAFPPVCP